MAAGGVFQSYKFQWLNSAVLIVNFEVVSQVDTVLLLITLDKSMSTEKVLFRFSN